MKLAEALQERADLNRKIDEIRRRLGKNILVQEGEAPAEDPNALLVELNACIDRLETLMAAINRTNGRTRVNGMTLTELIAKKTPSIRRAKARTARAARRSASKRCCPRRS